MEKMGKCVICVKSIKDNERTTCVGCQATYHTHCIGLPNCSPASTKSWKCPSCKPKSKRGDNKDVSEQIAELRNHFDLRFDTFKKDLMKEFEEKIKLIQDTVTFLNSKYEEVVNKSETLQKEIITVQKSQEEQDKQLKELKQETSFLKSQIEDMEQQNRANNLEIRDIPETDNESLEQRLQYLRNLCQHLNVTYTNSDVYTTFRSGQKKKDKIRPIVVMFKNVFLRNDILKASKDYHKNCKDRDKRLQTAHLGFAGDDPRLVYVSEHLSPKLKYLLAKSREIKKSHNYRFCWIANGKIFLKKNENPGSKAIWVKDEEFLKTIL
ncbi:hypothetical protein O0L34_g5841 [Tuta absoluta]|nr:hypothetical protein O0L34_g5841 [Tuta absoluta]